MPAKRFERFSVNALNWKSVSALVVLAVAVMVSITLTIGQDQWVLSLAIAVVVFAAIAWLLATAKIDIIEDKLVAGGGFYKVKVPLDRIDVAHARILPLDDPFRLSWRTNGLGWPGLNLGWFSSKGPKRVFAVDTRKADRVYVPTFENFDIVLTPTNPNAFLNALGRADARNDQAGSAHS
ncbi:PH domain-containing protein [Xanthomonas albilineans]|uniref:PH domain-containing protein n=1 Tax=Xanthomonas albilineans TaxID=29447 RepID=UPI0009BB194C|nr:PH domain-containing protein [Xanthomonas albilineans]